ncbi:LacI family DNA-binding transcriptional regulator [Streptococcus dentapri]|uniref:LacI family DNA-binding transcriptional regulator n=1 Tax=Streptococcus dentapri TaxID=573564 RepID=A0ABV8D079_9STRE
MVAKLTDVAKLAGVSPTTVSRVINKKGYLSKKTINKVNKAMRELGYKPNSLARGLQGKSAKLVGLIFPNIGHIFYAELIEQLEHELFRHGYKTIICNSEQNSEKEREYLEMLEANQVDGIISGSHNLGITDYDRVTAPIISFDRNLSPQIPVVSSDNFAGGAVAAQTLVKAGCQNIMMLTGNDDTHSPTGLRYTGFQSILPEAQHANIASEYSASRKEMEIKKLITQLRPDGIFTSGDLMAMLVLKIAQELDISIPQELKLIGYDGTTFVENYLPQLTTIKQPIPEIAQLTVELLLKKIAGENIEANEYTLPISLIPGRTI